MKNWLRRTGSLASLLITTAFLLSIVGAASPAFAFDCEAPGTCAFPYSDGFCADIFGDKFLGCCGGPDQRQCVVGVFSDAPSACAPGLVETPEIKCQLPRLNGETCGPSFPCLDSLTCTPVIDKTKSQDPVLGYLKLECMPSTGDQLLDKDACLVFYSSDLAQAAKDANLTLNFGVGSAASAGVSGTDEIGVFYSQDGKYGCYLKVCAGVLANVAIGDSACVGFSNDFDAFVGTSFVSVQGVGEGATFQTSQSFTSTSDFPLNPDGTADCVGYGADLSPIDAGIYQCITYVTIAKGNTPPSARCKDTTVSANASCQATASVNNGSFDQAANPITLAQAPPGPYNQGITGVSLTVTDNLGASDSCTATVTVVDTTPPSIICPAPRVVECTGASSATTLLTASASDNCGFATTSCPASGRSFPLGTTPVSCTATDGSNNSSSCSSSVTVVDTTPPSISCPAPIKAECTGPNGASVTPGAASASDICTGVTVAGPAAGTYPIGTSNLAYTATDGVGNTSRCSATIQVVDTTPPTITSVRATPNVLWPPDLKLAPVNVAVSVTDVCDPTAAQSCHIISVTSNERVVGAGSGNTSPDWEITGKLTANLRAERSGPGSGRTYTLTVQCTDASNNSSTAAATVTVPHDQGQM